MSTTSATSTYSSPILSTFATNPLTTTFSAPTSCSGIYSSSNVFVIDADTACLPDGFASASTDYFSPGVACPSGYVTACHDNAGVSSITTVTCCPYRGDITLGCVTPSTLSGVWSTLFCTWIAPDTSTAVSVTLSGAGTTSTAVASMISPGGLNALGVRMVYESSDVATTGTTGTTGTTTSNSGNSPATATTTSTGSSSGASSSSSSSSDSSLSTGATVAIAVVLSVLGIAAVLGAFFFLRKRNQRRPPYGAVGPGSAVGGPDDQKFGAGYYKPENPHELPGAGSQGVTNRQHELMELGPANSPAELEHTTGTAVELPASDAWR